ncbi:MAG: DNA mismatch repair endonuclease MutL [Bacteroidota bacterium]
MSDIIQLLPDAVANQIAAGEVIQRPASAVKELLENAVDAGSTHIQVIIKDSGKTLIQVIDNGCGMSDTDARMCFERHATSKIRKAEDLFSIRTMGFRGEAMPSIAAIAQVEMKTRKHDEETGTRLVIEGAEVKAQEAISTAAGTSISVKNLFYNIPARRNFLKSNPVEARHVIEEFERVALAQPQVAMSLHQNGMEVFQHPVSNFRQRIVNLYGANYNERLVPVQEETSLLNIVGFVGKPQFARKTRGEQYLFVNRRFIKDGYLHHAITGAFAELLPRDSFASYWLHLDIDPSKIDVNIHPTKTEVKFEDERSVYSIVRASVKRALGQYSVTPAIDFEQERAFDIPHAMRKESPREPVVMVDTAYNPFREKSSPVEQRQLGNMYAGVQMDVQSLVESQPVETEHLSLNAGWNEELIAESDEFIFQLQQRYIITRLKTGLLFIDQQAAHERILFERYQKIMDSGNGPSQQSLFPQVIELNAADYEVLKDIAHDIRGLGFDLQEFGQNAFVIHGTPADVPAGDEKQMIEKLLEQFKNNQSRLNVDRREGIVRAMAKNSSIKNGKFLNPKEMKQLIDELFACEKPFLSIDGKSTAVKMDTAEIKEMFRK